MATCGVFILRPGRPWRGLQLVKTNGAGFTKMALAIEPMLVLGSNKVHVLEDEWTVVSSYGNFASHWENTIAITENGPEILTKL